MPKRVEYICALNAQTFLLYGRTGYIASLLAPVLEAGGHTVVWGEARTEYRDQIERCAFVVVRGVAHAALMRVARAQGNRARRSRPRSRRDGTHGGAGCGLV